MRQYAVWLALALAAAAPRPRAQERAAGEAPYEPFVEAASAEGQDALQTFELADGLAASLYAAEPMLANPVCLYADYEGNVFVAETFRHYAGVTDMRDHMEWLHEDLRNRTVEDRVAMLRRHEGDALEAGYGTEHERVRLLRDRDGDLRADEATVFADGFNEIAAGIAAGLLSYRGEVFYACIPHLWKLIDSDGDGSADARDALSSGYGVNIALLGHDLHGLRIGPDRRLYFSCGDRGFSVETPNGRIEHPHTGAVLRCELDGSGLEVFATGLRNPQELVFDEFGDLFTGDNNSDGGDRARWVYVLPGSDSGWRYSYQWLTQPNMRGPWNDEKIWYPPFEGQAAYVLPPIANLGDGPSGLAYYPGTGLSEAYRGHFFLCDFRGLASISGVHTFPLVRKGAGYELGPLERLVWGTLVTDCDFTPDGALLFSDWVDGWNTTGKGRLYRVNPVEAERERAARTAELLAADWSGLALEDVAGHLAHPDQRVRQEAHFELVDRGATELLAGVASESDQLFARVHALWGLGILARTGPSPRANILPTLRGLARDDSPEVRVQVARLLGELVDGESLALLVENLASDDARLQLASAIALGRLGRPEAVGALFELAATIDTHDVDPWLRFGAIAGLEGCADVPALVAAKKHESVQARLAAVVALRRARSPRVRAFLGDADELVRIEAARAICDEPIEAALPALARVLEREDLSHNGHVRRALTANFRLGGADQMRAVARFAQRTDQDPARRREAIEMLTAWADPPPLDWFLGDWRPPTREVSQEQIRFLAADLAFELQAPELADAPVGVRLAWIELAASIALPPASVQLQEWIASSEVESEVRVASLEALERIQPERYPDALRAALADPDVDLRAAALADLALLPADEALPIAGRVLATGETGERRAAYTALGELQGARASALLEAELVKLAADAVPAELALDLVQAAESKGSAELDALLQSQRDARALDPVLQPWLDCLQGGDAERGESIFKTRAELSCTRCHLEGDAAADAVGQDLRGIGERLSRLQLLEAIIDPNRRVAPGYESVLLVLDDDEVLSGRILDEGPEVLHLIDPDGVVYEIGIDEIRRRHPGLSAMPGGLESFLSRTEMRDLIEYLSDL